MAKKDVEDQITSIVIDNEYFTAKTNRQYDNEEYESFIDLFDAERSEKDYDWMSDISLPEFTSHMLTQSSIDVAQYFKTRDFIEVYVEDEGDEAKGSADAAKELINRTLNQKHLHHYPKYVRAKTINHLVGSVYLECWWEQELNPMVVGQEERIVDLDVDELGNEITDLTTQIPARGIEVVDIEEEVPVIDRFNYDVIDPRNVFTDNSYVYTLQDKPFIIIRSEKTLNELYVDADRHGYFNLDKLVDKDTKEDIATDETETSSETYNKEDEHIKINLKGNKPFDILRRYGLFWVKVTERDGKGVPVKAEPGIDADGNILKSAELQETIITHAVSGSTKVLIGFNLTPYLDADGVPYKPIIRGLCYVHPSRDNGAGDGKYSRELQIAIDDTFNMSNDRVRLATIPTFKGKKYELDDNDSVYMEPGHTIPLNHPDDLQEIVISDNINGSLQQLSMLTGGMDKVMSIYPTTMGSTPVAASTTATAVAGAESRTDMRSNYKAMTFENTAAFELYWMIQQMTYAFAKEPTARKLMGNKLKDFDPRKDYYYRPVSASIETDQSKDIKIQRAIQLYGYTTNVQHPDAVKVINSLLKKVYELWGDEFVNIAGNLFDEAVPMEQGAPVQTEGMALPTSNQSGLPQSMAEQSVRGAM